CRSATTSSTERSNGEKMTEQVVGSACGMSGLLGSGMGASFEAMCHAGGSVMLDTLTNGSSIVIDSQTATSGSYSLSCCPSCGMPVTDGLIHNCCTSPPWINPIGIGTSPCVPEIFPFFPQPPQECALCDKLLESDDKKVCKECRGVFEAWKWLSKKDP